jgi:YgiT-type zinc finger domain-containing protein
MKCVLCKHGKTYSGKVNVTLERDDCIIVLKDVPADICENCGEYYLSQSTTAEVLDRAERSIAMLKLKFFALLPNFWNMRSSLKDLEARFSNERLRQRITDIANRSSKILESIAISGFEVVGIKPNQLF